MILSTRAMPYDPPIMIQWKSLLAAAARRRRSDSPRVPRPPKCPPPRLRQRTNLRRAASAQPTSYLTVNVDGLDIFYREAGPRDAPVLLMLHGFPSSSRMFEPLLRRLSGSYRIIAPIIQVSATPRRRRRSNSRTRSII